jgi:hypothetical protein
VGFAVSATDLSSLLAASVEEVAALITEHGAIVQEIGVSGVMEIDDGHRAWGFATLEPRPSDGRHHGRVMLQRVTVERVACQQWRALVVTGERDVA